MKRRALALGLVLGFLVMACSAGDSGGRAESAAPSAGRQQAGEEAVDADAAAPDVAEGDGAASADESSTLPLGEPIARSGDRVIKEGTVALEVADNGFDSAYAAVVDAARTLGGSVVSSSTTNADERGTFGSVTVRVPVERYEDLLVRVADIGTVRERRVNAEDVSAEYVDLESRLTHLEAQERFYLGLLEDAESVQDAIAVQQQLEDIQAQMEQIKGRLLYLSERTSFSILTVELFEPGASPASGEIPGRPTLAGYWETARDAFVTTVGGLLVAVTFLLPIAVVAGAATLVWRTTRRRPIAGTGE